MKNIKIDTTAGTLQLKEVTSKLFKLREEKKKFDEYYTKANKQYVSNISNIFFTMFPKGTKKETITLDEGVGFYDNPVTLNVNRIQSQRIIWDKDKLKKKLSKELYNKAVTKTYTLTDTQAFMNYMKELGANPKKIKKFILVDESVNEPALDNMYETGELTLEDVKGCFETKVSEAFVKLTEVK